MENNQTYINESKELEILNNQNITKTPQSVKGDLPKYWEKEYINSHIDMIKNPQHRMMFTFLWMSGVRISECISVRKRDVDLDNYTVTVRWLKSRKYNHRIVPLHPELRNMLQVYMANMLADDRLFNWTRQRAYEITKKYFNGNPHKFRHSFAVNWLRNAGDVVILHKILGHSRLQTTMEYLKIVPIDQGKELMKVQFR